MKIDIKSLIIGILITVIVFLALGSSRSTAINPYGRYLIEASQNDVYVVDTYTGQVWSMYSTGRSDFWKHKNLVKQTDRDTDQP